jgi:hypothetical protein
MQRLQYENGKYGLELQVELRLLKMNFSPEELV